MKGMKDRHHDVDESSMPSWVLCFHCSESRPPCLKWIKIGQERTILCHNCHQVVKSLRPRPKSVKEMRERLKLDLISEEWLEAYKAGVIIHWDFSRQFKADPSDIPLFPGLVDFEEDL
jgi:hypothetical protein